MTLSDQLAHVAVQVLHRHPVVRAHVHPLDDGPRALDPVRMHISAYILSLSVSNCLMVRQVWIAAFAAMTGYAKVSASGNDGLRRWG